jgi:TctA family transporter
MLDLQAQFLIPVIVIIAAVSAYSLSNSFTDVLVPYVFSGWGLLVRGLEISLILAAILAPQME